MKNDIESILKEQGFSKTFINKFMNLYSICLKKNIPYPFFYVMVCLKD
jgi:hypothetical protein